MPDTVTVQASVTFKRWNSPTFATQELPQKPQGSLVLQLGSGIAAKEQAPVIHVRDLEQAVLDALAVAWITDLYAKAEKKPPVLSFQEHR